MVTETTVGDGSISAWLRQLEGPERERAAAGIWNCYHGRLLGLAHKLLAAGRQRSYGAEDVVQEAFAAFFRAMSAGRFPLLEDRDDLWRLLAEITRNRAADFLKCEARGKRGGGRLRGESAFENGSGSLPAGVDQIPDGDEQASMFNLVCAEFLASLEPELLQVAILKMEGLTNGEIAARLGRVEKTVERKLKLIRARWLHYAPSGIEVQPGHSPSSHARPTPAG